MSVESTLEMCVVKRSGEREPVSFDKVLRRIQTLSKGLTVNATGLAQQVLADIHDGVHTTELDEIAARIAVSFMTTHPDWGTLGAHIIVSNCQRSAPARFSEAMAMLGGVLAPSILAYIAENADALDAMIAPANDFLLDYFGFKTLERGYLNQVGDRIVETPQYMWLRVAVGIWGPNGTVGPVDDMDPALRLTRIRETYELMSAKAFTHATPTLFNAGAMRPQLSSCYLLGVEDSIEGIYDALKKCAQISKYAGGIGIHVSEIRAEGAHIKGTNGKSNGIIPFLRVFNNSARAVDQGGRRNGSIAVYLEPWHADVSAFLKLKLNSGIEEERARDLFYALWIPDLFMRRVEAGASWSLFCPSECPGLVDAVGPAFDALYERYEAEGRARKTMPAQKLWQDILISQIETGTPYLLYKDAANLKSNQKNLGTIRSSNLCVAPETLVLTDRGHLPIRDLASETETRVWNGDAWSSVKVLKTGEAQRLLTVTLSNGAQLQCTPYHKFIVFETKSEAELGLARESSLVDARRVDAADLVPGMRVSSVYILKDKYVVSKGEEVVSVVDDGRVDDTYCFNEPLNHAGVFNGILTGNCTEIIEYSSPEEIAVCNLASIALPFFVEDAGTPNRFNFDRLRQVVAILVRNLNRIIDINYYPTPETRASNMRHRPIGIGVQGLADVFARLGLAWESPEAAVLNREIFENIYFAAVYESSLLASRQGAYSTFAGSPASQGILQPQLWDKTDADLVSVSYLDWQTLRERVQRDGLRNSLLVAPMPTASTSQILGYNECIEPFTTNIYVRHTKAGEFTVLNRYLIEELIALGLWNADMKERIVAANGSVQGLVELSPELKARYKTAWEMSQKTLIDMAADRGPFICQSQSLNLFVHAPTIAKLSSMHMYGWKRGLKTGLYYLRTRSAVQAIKFTVAPVAQVAQVTQGTKGAEDATCLMCSS